MTLTLHVGAGWRKRIRERAAEYSAGGPVVPVVKGNGYGFGRGALAELAAPLGEVVAGIPATIAVGTVYELAGLPPALGGTPRPMVLVPVRPPDVPAARDVAGTNPILTIASPGDAEPAMATFAVGRALGTSASVVVKLRSSMQRLGASPTGPDGLDAVEAAVAEAAGSAGLTVDHRGYSVHLPLAGTDEDRRAELDAWLEILSHRPSAPHVLWVSHLSPASHAALAHAWPQWRFPIRVGTALWHGDKSDLHLTADVVALAPIRSGECAGYHASPAPSDGWLVVIGAGTAHGVVPLDDGRSPFHFDRHRLGLLERPHMHTSIVFVRDGQRCPEIGDAVDVQRPLITVTPDVIDWEPEP